MRSFQAIDSSFFVQNREAIDRSLAELFDAERNVRRLHDALAALPQPQLLDALADALTAATKEANEDESSLRLVRVAALLGEHEGPRVVDLLIDILASEHPEARKAAGDELSELAFERFKDVASGVERALKRLPVGSPALPELPYLLAELPEPGVMKLLAMFIAHRDPEAVAASIEALVEIGDPAGARLLAALAGDERTVELAEEGDDAASEVTIGELAAEALELLQEGEEGEGEE